MLYYPDNISPVAFSLGPLKVHWYGLMYLFGFVSAWLLGTYRAKKTGFLTQEQVTDLIFYGAIGVIVGGRVGYMVFYDLPDLIHHPLSLFYVWDGGMSFHGGMLGVLVALYFYSRYLQENIWDVIDFIVPFVPIGLGAGRVGNFINGELWGRVTTVPWGMVYPGAGPLPRHPSEVYEFLLEGVALFLLVWFFSSKPRPRFAATALFLLAYGSFRFFCEFFRQPDPQYGYLLFGWMTMGQILSFPMIIIGILSLYFIYGRKKYNA